MKPDCDLFSFFILILFWAAAQKWLVSEPPAPSGPLCSDQAKLAIAGSHQGGSQVRPRHSGVTQLWSEAEASQQICEHIQNT